MLVVALALHDAAGRFLLQQRPLEKHHGGLWEFPGGKVEIGEIPRLALCREIREELDITISPDDLLPAFMEDEGAGGGIVMILYTARCWTGSIAGLEGQQWGWFSLAEMAGLPMPPMDRSFAARLDR
ncbi:MAG: (deoxy)nucleoside triphosphate pyrophosphohydrolase [Alteraurantiacibacter sp.]